MMAHKEIGTKYISAISITLAQVTKFPIILLFFKMKHFVCLMTNIQIFVKTNLVRYAKNVMYG